MTASMAAEIAADAGERAPDADVKGASPTPRAIGAVRLSARRRGAQSVLETFRQSGSAKALFPRSELPSLEVALLNTAGGVTGGDRFSYEAAAGPDAHLRLSTQAAERGYRAQRGEIGRIDVALTAERGARIDWLPQETILFDGAALRRRLSIALAPGATLLAAEPIIFGRRAMGERLRSLCFSDQWRVRLGGRLIYADALRLEGDLEAALKRRAVGGGATAFASLLYVGEDAGQRLTQLRPLLPVDAGASLPSPNVLTARLLAPDGFSLRRSLAPALRLLANAPLPKLWTM